MSEHVVPDSELLDYNMKRPGSRGVSSRIQGNIYPKISQFPKKEDEAHALARPPPSPPGARPPPPATPRPASRPASHPKPSRRCRTTPPHIPTPRPSANPPGGQPTEAAALQLWRPDYQTAQCTTLCPARPQRAPCVQASVKQPYRSFKERDTDDSAQRAPAHRRAAAPRPLSYPRHAPPPPATRDRARHGRQRTASTRT